MIQSGVNFANLQCVLKSPDFYLQTVMGGGGLLTDDATPRELGPLTSARHLFPEGQHLAGGGAVTTHRPTPSKGRASGDRLASARSPPPTCCVTADVTALSKAL